MTASQDRKPRVWIVAILFTVMYGLVTSRPEGEETIIDGYVYRGLHDHTGEGYAPVRGAVVVSDRNPSAFVTDARGHFELAFPRLATDEFVKITVSQHDKVLLRQRVSGATPRIEINLIVPEHSY